MAKRKRIGANTAQASATVGYEAELWRMADALPGSMGAAECKRGIGPDPPKRQMIP